MQVFPWKNRRNGELVTAETFKAPDDSVHLYRHFLTNGRIVGVPCIDDEILSYTGRDVCRMITGGNVKWKDLVPEVAWTMAQRHASLRVS